MRKLLFCCVLMMVIVAVYKGTMHQDRMSDSRTPVQCRLEGIIRGRQFCGGTIKVEFLKLSRCGKLEPIVIT